MAGLKRWQNWVGFVVMLAVVRLAERQIPQIRAVTNPGA